MIKKLTYLFISFVFSVFSGFTQSGINSWIDFNNQYYKFDVVNEGIYRINKNTLTNAGIDVSSFDPENIQLFCKGKEQYIHIHNEFPYNIFGDSDYIEFYAVKNDGSLDSVLYQSPENQINPYYSLINDTNTYFLTWNTSLNNKRYDLETDTAFSSYTPALYCIKPVLSMEISSFSYGAPINGSYYTGAEGWFGNYFGKSSGGSISSKTKTVNTPNAYTGGQSTHIEIGLAGASNAASASSVNHHLQISFLSQTFDTVFTGYKSLKKSFDISSSLLSTSIDFTFSVIDDLNATTDYYRFSNLYVEYPHTFDFEGADKFKFIVTNSQNGSKSFLQITNFNGGSNPVLYDLTNHKKITLVENSGVYNALIPNSGNNKTCYIASENSINYIVELKPVSFTDYSVTNFNADYIIISHPLLWNEAQLYESYRNATGYNVLLADINELYDQFAYGIRKHPVAIRNFIDYLINIYDSVPKNLFLLGKSINVPGSRNNTTNYYNNLVPSFGNPPSDILLTSGLNGTLYQPAIPTGRVAASTAQEAENYLNKVIEFESNEPEEWMKEIIHFGGGVTSDQQTTFALYLSQYEDILEDTLFGGHVTSFYKTSSAPMQISQAEAVKARIDSGVTFMTFFGHGSSSGFDVNVEHASLFNNRYKYPMIIANSCLAGDIHQVTQGISEEWVLIGEKGSIGFLATVDESFEQPLHQYSKILFQNIAYENYGKSIGKCIQETIKKMQSSYNSPNYVNTFEEFTLHGDPAIILNSQPLPDLKITSADISFSPQIVSTEIDSFDVNISITNIGMATADTFVVKLIRTGPNITDSIEYFKAGCYYKDTISIRLPVDQINGIGLNTFCVYLDSEHNITELSENNNNACVNQNILSGDLIPVYPYEYAIYPNNTVKLKASTGNPFTSLQTSRFEIDTTDTYNSPALLTGTVTHQGGVVEWNQTISLQDSTVYFWRVSKDSVAGSSYNWKESSFIYIPGKTGWSQAHHFQFKKDDYKYIDFNRNNRSFDFVNYPRQLHCRNIGSANTDPEFLDIYYEIDNSIRSRSSCCANSAILVAVIDTMFLENWNSVNQDFGHANYPVCSCYQGSSSYNFFVFYTDSASLSNLANFLQYIPNGNYILAYTFRNCGIDTWPEELYQAFENLYPATSIRTTPGNYPLIFFTKKGDNSFTQEIIGDSATAIINLYADLPTDYTQGNITSTIVGPTSSWQTLHWRYEASENPCFDSLKLDITGLKNLSANEDTLLTINSWELDIYDLFNSIDANIYPYLKLNLFNKDDSLKTPSQLRKWQLTYEGIPETAINPPKGYYFYKDTVFEGDDIVFSIATENISDYDMDSLLVTYWHQDKNNNLQNIKTKRLKKHPSGDIITDTVRLNTLGYPGLNSIWVEFNPVDTQTGNYDQLEQYHFNNIAQVFFYVESDNTNPILDVTFDGIHILDGDIVSANPEILISLKDENKFMALNDQSLFKIWLKSPGEEEEVLIPFDATDENGNKVLQWTPANLPDNSCKILYTPGKLKDGTYMLRVSATDASLNESGDIDYYINFEVINKATITNVFNYPNPFSTSTRFVFELTGSEIPTDFQIQIFTITGKLVKVIDLTELGNIHIGRNITDYAWDGKDMYGDQLANGLYFYRITTKLNGENIEKRDTQTDQYFKHNIGKMYLMR